MRGRPAGPEQTLSADVVDTIAGSPEVAAVDRFRSIEVPYGDTRVRVGGGDFAVRLEHGTLLFKAPADARDAMRRAIGQDAVVVSESFVIKQHVDVGGEVRLPTAHGVVPFRVAAVYYDYSSDRGVLVMDRATFVRHYGDSAASGLSVYLRPGRGHEAGARSSSSTRIGEAHRVLINTNASLRTEVLRIFDSTFAITYALEIIAILVAILGVSGTLLTLILERRTRVHRCSG